METICRDNQIQILKYALDIDTRRTLNLIGKLQIPVDISTRLNEIFDSLHIGLDESLVFLNGFRHERIFGYLQEPANWSGKWSSDDREVFQNSSKNSPLAVERIIYWIEGRYISIHYVE